MFMTINIFSMLLTEEILLISSKKYRHGNFFAFSTGWLMSEEDFMEIVLLINLSLELAMENWAIPRYPD